MFLNEMKHDPVMNPKQMLHECVANVFLFKYEHKEPQGRRETVFLSSGNSSHKPQDIITLTTPNTTGKSETIFANFRPSSLCWL